MYEVILFLHSWIRWLLLLLLIIVVIRAISGLRQRKVFTRTDDKLSVILLSLFHLQLLMGLLLYISLSPITKAIFGNFGAAMKNEVLRYWAIEHIFVMILSITIAQIGRIIVKRSESDKSKFKNELIYFLMAFMLILARIPWSEPVRMMRGIID